MANVIFGKTIQSTENKSDIKLVKDWKNDGKALDARSLCKNVRFKSFKIFSENLVAIELNKVKNPIVVGFAILELSKYHFYSFYYDFLLAQVYCP
jgi:hypothetical protein